MTRFLTLQIQSLRKPCWFNLQMDLGLDHSSSPSQLPSGPGAIVSHVDYLSGLQIAVPASPLYPLTVSAQQQPEVVAYQNAGLIMSFLYSKLQMLPFLKGGKPKTLKRPTRPHVIHSPLPTLPHAQPYLSDLITSCLSHTHPSRASTASYWSLHTRHAPPLCHCADPSSALNSHDSSPPFLESLLKTHLLH